MGCGAKKEKQSLIKLTKGKNHGRGAYICYNEDCLNECIKTKRLERSLGKKIENEIYEELRVVILNRRGIVG